jgi:hypothetical protein
MSFVSGWLDGLELGDYAALFESRDMSTKEELVQLLDESFCSTQDQLFYVGITNGTHRTQLELAVAELSKSEPTIVIEEVRKRKDAEEVTSEDTNTPQRDAFAAFNVEELCAWLKEVELPLTSALCKKKDLAGPALLELVDDEAKGVASVADMLR